MDLIPRQLTTKEIKLAGKKVTMDLLQDRTYDLWRNFMLQLKESKNDLSVDKYCVKIYPNDYFKNFSPSLEFEKWAAIELDKFLNLPSDMELINIPAGNYAVFDYKGPNTDHSIYNYIFTQWLPSSGFEIDERPHFEIMGKHYKNADPGSEEEIWIPVRSR